MKYVKSKKGFTLVELLAVIVILGVIMVIAIPSVLETMEVAKVKSLQEYGQKVKTNGESKYLVQKEFEGLTPPESSDVQLYVYDIKEDLDLTNTGNYKGVFLMFKFGDRFFEKVELDEDDSKRMKPNTPLFGVMLQDDSNVLVYMGQNADSLEDGDVYSLDEMRNNMISTKPEDIPFPDSIVDLYINMFSGKEGFVAFFNGILDFLEEQLAANGLTIEQAEAMATDGIKFIVVDGDSNEVVFKTSLLGASIICSCNAEPASLK